MWKNLPFRTRLQLFPFQNYVLSFSLTNMSVQLIKNVPRTFYSFLLREIITTLISQWSEYHPKEMLIRPRYWIFRDELLRLRICMVFECKGSVGDEIFPSEMKFILIILHSFRIGNAKYLKVQRYASSRFVLWFLGARFYERDLI